MFMDATSIDDSYLMELRPNFDEDAWEEGVYSGNVELRNENEEVIDTVQPDCFWLVFAVQDAGEMAEKNPKNAQDAVTLGIYCVKRSVCVQSYVWDLYVFQMEPQPRNKIDQHLEVEMKVPSVKAVIDLIRGGPD